MIRDLRPTILQAGLDALASGDPLTISAVVIGEATYAPHRGMTDLVAPRARYPIAESYVESDSTRRIRVLADGPGEFWVGEIGFELSTGVLLAIYSDPDYLGVDWHTPDSPIELDWRLVLSALPADQITVVNDTTAVSPDLSRRRAEVLRCTGQTRLLTSLVAGYRRDLDAIIKYGRGMI